MKKILWCVAVLSALAFSSTAMAVEGKPPVVGVVDVQAVLQKSAVAKSIRAQIDEKLKSYQADVSAREAELKKAEQELMKQRSILKPEDANKQRADLQKKFMAVQKEVNSKKTSLDAGFSKAMTTVMENLRKVVSGIAGERGINLVLTRQQVVYADDAMDLTDEVLKRLNSQLSSIKVDFSAPKPAASSTGG
ncbi:MAG: OmpH family outer membrane protein [Pseudomonadota bacterium]|nr:OmpH family outer membrane protein [Pseudomonadota bacterium]